MSKNARSPRKRVTAIFKLVKAILIFLGITGGILVLPEQLNRFIDECPVLRERWLNATQWTGMYSSFPERLVNMAELDLSWESDVTISLNYSEETHSVDGYIHSDTFCEMGLLYRNVLLVGSPSIWAPNRLNMDAYKIAGGHTVILGKIRIDRGGGIIAVTSIENTGGLFEDTLRLAADSELKEEEQEFRCLKPVAGGSLANPGDIDGGSGE